jgi:Tfp pilus assembly protein FimT
MATVTASIEVIRAIRVARAKAMKDNTPVSHMSNERREWEGR